MIYAFQRFAFAVSAAVLLTACGLSQPVIGTPGVSFPSHALPVRAHSPKYMVLYSFLGKRIDGSHPTGSLLDVNGVLYGATSDGGTSNAGTVFSVTTSGAEQMLYSFKKYPDGTHPVDGLIDVNGTLYGTTYKGGDGHGTLYSFSTSGVEQILYKFPKTEKNLQGSFPSSSLLEENGTFYGSTSLGGKYNGGVVFGVTIGSTAIETVLHNFGSAPDGSYPAAGVIDVHGTLYGTTPSGGAYSGCFNSCGTVYSLTTSGSEQVLHSFGYGTDGSTPRGGLIDMRGTLYGVTSGGGTYGKGTVFSITTSGSEKVLYNFTGGADGGTPFARLINVRGTLYGTTAGGGDPTCNCGTIYSISASGAEKVLYSFKGGSDGSSPSAPLLHVKRVLYGTTASGGSCHNSNGCGTVFALSL